MAEDMNPCTECGSTEWTTLIERQKTERTTRTVYRCEACGAEGRKYHGDRPTRFTGALRP